MSKEIAEIKVVGKDKIRLTQFFESKKDGLCLQLGLGSRSHASLTKKQTQLLVKELQNWLGENELLFTSAFHSRCKDLLSDS